jgi:hypothetical protein
MKAPTILPRLLAVALLLVGLLAPGAHAVLTWGVDLGSSSLSIDADTYADNGANLIMGAPGAVWDEAHPANAAAFQANYQSTFDLGQDVNPMSRDADTSVPFTTTASSIGQITIHGLGTDTLTIEWRANTLNDNFDGDGFISDSSAVLTSTIIATINGASPGTPLTIGYDWEYFATAVPDHEGVMEDPELAGGNLSFMDDQGGGPGSLFSVAVSEPGPLTSMDSDNDSYDLTTNVAVNTLSVSLGSNSLTHMEAPGLGINMEDTAGSEFLGRLTLTVTAIPEVTSAAMLAAAASLVTISWSVRRLWQLGARHAAPHRQWALRA